MAIEEVENLVKRGKPLEEIVGKFDWKDFEKIVAEIFEKNNFHTEKNFRFKTKNRYEIDVVAIKEKIVFVVDCKEWSNGRYKKSGLKTAVEKQERRMKEFEKFLKINPIARDVLKLKEEYKICPLIVTWLQEDLIKENETLVVPTYKLNSFLVDVESYI